MSFQTRFAFCFVAAVVVIVVATSCDRSGTLLARSATVPTPLLGDFRSHDSIAAVETALRAQGAVWTVVEDTKLSPGDSRPRFDQFVISVAGYTYLRHTGELRLRFFNDRLSTTTFYPDDLPGFLPALSDALGRPVGWNPEWEIVIPPVTQVYSGKDFRSLGYVAWQDAALATEEDAWIGRYA